MSGTALPVRPAWSRWGLLGAVLGASLSGPARAEALPLPMEPLITSASAAAAPGGTWSVSGGVAAGWTGAPRGGVAVGANVWPVRRVMVRAGVFQGAADLTCVSCTGTLGRLSVRANAVELDAVRIGLYGALDGTLGLGATGAAHAGPVVEGGGDRLRVDLAAPLWSTVDILEDARTGWESGVTWRHSASHTTRVGTVGPRFRPTLSHRFTSGKVWTSAEGVWAEAGPILRIRAGIRM